MVAWAPVGMHAKRLEHVRIPALDVHIDVKSMDADGDGKLDANEISSATGMTLQQTAD